MSVVKVENVSKKYQIGTLSTGSLKGDFSRWWSTKVLKIDDHFSRFGESKDKSSEFWALKDISFKIGEGEAVAIIGKNGAGKSTLLKLLSRITLPTTGRIKVRGRIASLLEVGTGFNPELTGRENIYLNGAILGMTNTEVRRKFDEIVAFAGVEKFIDTPVKRYSSGMYVRLAFAVAAHLDSEILILDEVLAVGDAEFQKKCLRKMDEVSHQQGRTILFVSHSMSSVRHLCNRALLLEKGMLSEYDNVEKATKQYLAMDEVDTIIGHIEWLSHEAPQSDKLRFLGAAVTRGPHGQCFDDFQNTIDVEQDFGFTVTYELLQQVDSVKIGFLIQNAEGFVICGSNFEPAEEVPDNAPGKYTIHCKLPSYTLNVGTYYVLFGADFPYNREDDVRTPFCIRFVIEDKTGHGPDKAVLPGVVRPLINWAVSDFNSHLNNANVGY